MEMAEWQEDTREQMRLGKYRMIKPLGQGGEGFVWLAEDESLSRMAAVKRLWDEDEERIRNEAAFLRDLRHPMLPVVYDLICVQECVMNMETLEYAPWEAGRGSHSCLIENGWYLVMEYIDGISLHKYIESQGRIEEEQACLWAAALLDVLAYLHTRKTPVIYRDLKPDNIMVCRDGGLKLVDFGAAVFRNFGDGRDVGMAYTAGYAAPEQRGTRGGSVYADERSDLYAFGKLLYYMVTGADPGVPPYASLMASLYNPLLSEGVERVIDRCVCEDPEARYQVAGDVMADLKERSLRQRSRRRNFVRHVEKQVYLTEKEEAGLLNLEFI